MRAKRCPRCRLDLTSIQKDEITLQGCGRCGGVWLDNQDCKRLMLALPQEAVKVAEAAARAGKAVDKQHFIQCPSCGDPMVHRHMKQAGVFIDVCEADGTWFDAGEMAAVAVALHTEPPPAPPPVSRDSAADFEGADPRSPYAKGLSKIAEAAAAALRDAAEATSSGVESMTEKVLNTPVHKLLDRYDRYGRYGRYDER